MAKYRIVKDLVRARKDRGGAAPMYEPSSYIVFKKIFLSWKQLDYMLTIEEAEALIVADREPYEIIREYDK